MKSNRSIKLSEIIELLGGELVGDDLDVDHIAPVDKAQQGSCTFIVHKKHVSKLLESEASAIIVPYDCAEPIQQMSHKVSLILCDNPYLYFSKLMTYFYPRKKLVPSQKQFFQIDSSAQLASSVVVSDFVTIGAGTILSDNVEVYPGSFIGANVVIGANTVIHPNVTIMDRVIIGEHCIIHSGAVIGADGFGNAQDTDKHYYKIPQIGGVLIGDWVEIGANTTVDSGTFSPTKIGTGVRIDNLVMIAHNVVIGDHTAIAACTGIAGSTVVGKYCIIAGAANITGHVNIVDGTMIGGSSNVGNDITQPGIYSSGFPSMLHLQWGKLVALFKQLPIISSTMKNLQKSIEEISEEIAIMKRKENE